MFFNRRVHNAVSVVLGLFILLLWAGLLWAGPTKTAPRMTKPETKVPLEKLTLKTDLRVNGIYTSCRCQSPLDVLGALLTQGIWVDVAAYPCSGASYSGGNQVKARVTLRYYDHIKDTMVSEMKTATLTINSSGHGRKEVLVVAPAQPVLLRTSSGLTAEVELWGNSFPVEECNTSNNRRSERRCMPRPPR